MSLCFIINKKTNNGIIPKIVPAIAEIYESMFDIENIIYDDVQKNVEAIILNKKLEYPKDVILLL